MSTNPLESTARLVVDSVRAVTRRRIAVATAGLILTLLVASTYILVGSLGINPTRSTILVRVLLPESGGLLPNQDVTFRGVPIGRVQAVNLTATGVEAVAAIDADVRVPNDGVVRVSALSPAGEQYLDFRPENDRGAALTDGAVIGEDRTTIPVSLARLLAGADGMLAQLDPQQIAAMTDELRVGREGPQKLAALLDGGAFMISTLDSVLPQTVSVLRTSRTVFTTLADVAPGLRHTSQNLQQILRGVDAMEGGFRTLADRGGAPFTAMDNLVADNSATMVQLLGDLTTVSELFYLRVPALKELLDGDQGSSMLALKSIFHDGAVWAIVDPYPRYGCDYNLPSLPRSVPSYPEPYLYTYCDNPDPSILVRGARNAPRPPGDDTAGPPPGYDPLARSDPTPVGPNTVPTPFGGPPMPLKLPN